MSGGCREEEGGKREGDTKIEVKRDRRRATEMRELERERLRLTGLLWT